MTLRTPTTYAYLKSEFTGSGGVIDAPNLLKTTRDTEDIAIHLQKVELTPVGVVFEFRDSLPLDQKALVDAIVVNHDGTPLPAENVDEHGNLIFAPTFLHTSEQARLKGLSMSGTADSVVIADYEVTNEMLVQGGQFWVMGSQDGDTASFAVIDKNDILGLHTQLGHPIGTPIELVKYVDNYPLPPVGNAVFKDEIIMPTVAPVATGLFLRATLTFGSVPGNRRMGILYRWYIGG